MPNNGPDGLRREGFFCPICREAFTSAEALSSHYVAQHGKSRASAVQQPVPSLIHASGGATMSSTQRMSRDRTLSHCSTNSAFEDVAEYASLLSKVLDGVAANSEKRIRRAARESAAVGIDVAAALNTCDAKGRVAILEAASEGFDKAIHALHALGCDIDAKNEDGQRAIHFAASHGHERTLRLLVSLGADVDATTASDETALHLVAADGLDAAVECLISLGADVNKAERRDGWTAAHWAASGGHSSTLQLLWEAGARLDQTNVLGQSAIFCAVLAGSCESVRTMHSLGARLDLVAKDHTTLVDNALLLRDPQSINSMVATLINVKSAIHFGVVNQCIGANQPLLMTSAEKLMRAVIKQAASAEGASETIGSWHIRYIQHHFPLDIAMRLFDDCVQWSYSPIWTCFAIAMVFEEVARGSVTKNHLLRPHIETFVQRGVALANKLHHPEAEDRAFRDTGRLTLKQVLEPDIERLSMENRAICELTPMAICMKYRYSSIFNSYVVTEYVDRKWSGGRGLQVILRNLSDEIMERLALRPSKWVVTARLVRFVLPLLLAITCADDSSLTAAITQRQCTPEVFRRIFSNQSVRARQFFSVPLVRFFCELIPQITIIALYTYGSFEVGKFNYVRQWDPETRLFGHRAKIPLRTAEWIFVFFIMAQFLSECKQIQQEGLRAYFSDAFNVMDVGLLFNFLVVILLRIIANNTGAGDFVSPTTLQAIEIMMAIGGLLLWIRVLEAFAINRKLGPLLEMISKMFKDLITFFGLMFVITMGFATAFHHLFNEIPQYSSWTRTSITLLSNLIGEGFEWDRIHAVQSVSPTLATLGQVLLVLFILLGTILLLNLLIAILTDIFRRVSEEMAAEHNFEKARLVQRVMRKSQFACPPANLLQPMFFWVGSKQQSLPRGYPVEALFSQPLSPLQLRLLQEGKLPEQKGVFVDPDTRTQKSWHSATVLRPPSGEEAALNFGDLASSYLWYHVHFDDHKIETLNRADAVPIRARPGRSLPMMLDYGASEVRYLLDLLGSWPFLYIFTIAIFTVMLPYLSFVMSWQLFGATKRNFGTFLGWSLLPFTVLTGTLILVGVLTLLMLVLLALWAVQLIVSMRNVLRGGTKCDKHNLLRRRAELLRQAKLEHAAKGAQGRAHKLKRKKKQKRKQAKARRGRAGGMLAAAKQLEAADMTSSARAGDRARHWRQERLRCTYASRDAIHDVLQSSIYVQSVPHLDEKIGNSLALVRRTAMEAREAMINAVAVQEEMEARTWEGLHMQETDLRRISTLAQKRRLALAASKHDDANDVASRDIQQGADSGLGASIVGPVAKRRGALSQIEIAKQLESQVLMKQLRRFEREMLVQKRRRSTKKSMMSERGLRRRTSTGTRRSSSSHASSRQNV